VRVQTNFEIFAQCGKNTACDRTFGATVTTGQLQIAYTPGAAQNPKVNAIQVLATGPTVTPTFTATPGPSNTPTSTPTATATRTATATPGGGGTGTTVLSPTDDAYVSSANASTNFGSATTLQALSGAATKRTFLKFNLSSVGGDVENAWLTLTANSKDNCGDVDETLDVFATSSSWSEGTITHNNAPARGGYIASAPLDGFAAGARLKIDVTSGVTPGAVAGFQVDMPACANRLGTTSLRSSEYSVVGDRPTLTVQTVAAGTGVIRIAAAGDIVCDPNPTNDNCEDEATAALIYPNTVAGGCASDCIARVLTPGDHQYENGAYCKFVRTCPTGTSNAYTLNWGKFKGITRPATGNHEYNTAGAQGYFDYFGSAAKSGGQSYYSFDIGNWHIISLDSEIAHTASSAQVTWLRNDLAATSKCCVLAYWHRPLFATVAQDGHPGDTTYKPFWTELYNARADVVINGHNHLYESFAQQDPNGNATPDGIREIISGAGGKNHDGAPVGARADNSLYFNGNTFGVLKMDLTSSGYSWQFVRASDGAVLDSGSSACH